MKFLIHLTLLLGFGHGAAAVRLQSRRVERSANATAPNATAPNATAPSPADEHEALKRRVEKALSRADNVSRIAQKHLESSPYYVPRHEDGPVDLVIKQGAEADRHPFEGVGALSAGASSRLLRDYPAEQRKEILDLLFKPNYGASLQVLKVEIGGDMQSTDGSEPSHMRERDEVPDCTRGYETWLMQEAKARNPKIRTFGLAWGVPGWIGNGSFFTNDNIRYHVSWLQCIKETYKFEVDYIGVWNEMPWGEVWYVRDLAKEIKAQGLATRLVLLDAIHGVDEGFMKLFTKDPDFRDLVDAVGLHYPCESFAPLAETLKPHKQTRFWASEELSTVADWGGAGCWGRMINQNYVRMNATSSIAWSLVWSAYPNLECFGNGLLYAFEPWSGSYEVTPPVWATAHTSQFTEPGWQYLPAGGNGAGLLPGGGTYVTIVSPEVEDFSIVLETLQGQCFYHAGCFHTHEATEPQRFRLKLGEDGSKMAALAAKRGTLEVWATNKTHHFRRQPDAILRHDGSIELTVGVDAIVTVTTLRKATRSGDREEAAGGGGAQVGLLGRRAQTGGEKVPPVHAGFPLPFVETFDEHEGLRDPPYFADQGGAFELRAEEDSGSPGRNGSLRSAGDGKLQRFQKNMVLEQQVLRPPIAWIGRSPEPFTLVGGVNWTDMTAQVNVRFGPENPEAPGPKPLEGTDEILGIAKALLSGAGGLRHVGMCIRMARYHYFGGMQAAPEGYCLQIIDRPYPLWILTASGYPISAGRLSAAVEDKVVGNKWLNLRLEAKRARVKAWLEGEQVANVLDTSLPFGQVALGCGYHRCQFDDLDAFPHETEKAPAKEEASVVEKITARQAPRGPWDMFSDMIPTARKLLKLADQTGFEYTGRTCDPPPRLAWRRQDFTGFVGFAFEPKSAVKVEALGRLMVSGGHPWAQVHNISLFEIRDNGDPAELLSVALPTALVDQAGVTQTEDGWVYVQLGHPVELTANHRYVLMSSELQNGDSFYDKAVRAASDDQVKLWGPVYMDNTGWHFADVAGKQGGVRYAEAQPLPAGGQPMPPGQNAVATVQTIPLDVVYGPLNALLAPA